MGDSKTVLITGATGFIGRELCQRMLVDGWSVYGTVRNSKDCDRLPFGTRPVLLASIGQDTLWETIIGPATVVMHLAARVHVMRDRNDDPLSEYRVVNTLGTERLARAAAACGVRRFVYVSSIKVNGESTLLPFEEKDPVAPGDQYAISKWEAEQRLWEIGNRTGLEIVIIRPPMVYGPGVKGNFLRLLKLIDRQWPLPFRGVANKRSLVSLHNIVDFLACIAIHPKAAHELFFVSDGCDLSTEDLIKCLSTALGKTPRLFRFPMPLFRVLARIMGQQEALQRLTGSLQVSTHKAHQQLGWQAPQTIEEGMRSVAHWYTSGYHPI